MIALVLASASTSRHVLLKAAGLGVTIDPANIDENPVKMAMAAGGRSAADTALALAIRKAVVVSPRHPGALVIGGDQILHCGGRWFDKPETTDQARAHLVALRGRRHALATAVAVVRDGMTQWHHCESAYLTMHAFSDAFLESYLVAVGEEACSTVGAYRLEEYGVHLFESTDGDYFTILGLPLLALLSYLRNQQIVE
ncbi:MAG TPA: Maf family protein [Alphaproteobacteria bacterium]|jgi:septum formation protein|nr:Maf family protein [Alphaproteobacteria bacterium]